MRGRNQGPPPVEVFLIILCILALYAGVMWFRRCRFKALAPKLRGKHVPGKWLASGKLIGERFEIEARKGFKSLRTYVTVSVKETPGNWLIKADFFSKFPDWKHAKILGRVSERVFVTTVEVDRYVEPTSEQKEPLLRWFGSSIDSQRVRRMLANAKAREITLAGTSATLSFGGVVIDSEKLIASIEALRAFPAGSR